MYMHNIHSKGQLQVIAIIISYVCIHILILIFQHATIDKMFEAISKKLKVPLNQVYIVVNANYIEKSSTRTLDDYNICDKTTVRVHPVHVMGVQMSDKGKCFITGTEFPIKKLVNMSCGHTFSPAALVDYLDNMLSNCNETKLLCPVPECKNNWKQEEISNIGLQEEKIQGIMELFSTNLIVSKYSFKRCPQCKTLTERINEDHLQTECLVCSQTERYEFCWCCMRKWKNSNSNKVCGNEDCDPTSMDIIHQLQSCNVKEIHDIKNVPIMRVCPKCGVGIIHTSGSKHMICRLCNTEFCFVCLSIKIRGSWPTICGTWQTKCPVAPRQNKLPKEDNKTVGSGFGNCHIM